MKDYEETLMGNLGRIELGNHQGVKGLGLIVKAPVISPLAAVLVGTPLAALGVIGTYHTFGAISRTKSGWAIAGLALSGVVSAIFSLEVAALAVAGVVGTAGGVVDPYRSA